MGDCLSALWSTRSGGGEIARQDVEQAEQQRQLLATTWNADAVAEATQRHLEAVQRDMKSQQQQLLALRDRVLSTEAVGDGGGSGTRDECLDPSTVDQQHSLLALEHPDESLV